MNSISLSEFAIQKQIIGYLNIKKILYFAIPNGELRTKATGAKLKKMGVKRGIPDIFIPMPCCEDAGLWLEVKSINGKPTVFQRIWMNDLIEQGYAVHIVKSLNEAIECIEKYFNNH